MQKLAERILLGMNICKRETMRKSSVNGYIYKHELLPVMEIQAYTKRMMFLAKMMKQQWIPGYSWTNSCGKS